MPRPKNQRGRGLRRSERAQQRPPTEGFLPLPGKIRKTLRSLGNSFNFGLYFNKWLLVQEKTWKEEGSQETKSSLDYEFKSQGQAREVLDKYPKARSGVEKLLEQKHNEIENLIQAFKRLGYEPLVDNEYTLQTSLIIGLGNAHPTERGFTFHWTLGLPYIPAENIKGVVRLAYLVQKAEEDPDFFESWAREDEEFWEFLAKPFGRKEGENTAARGKAIFLDAFPVEVPELTLEITTCHYLDYYGGKRGPTEDQNPNPLPFLAVKPGAKFRFVVLVSKEIEDHKESLHKAFEAALTEHGFGAKTALGHGRFKT